MAFGGNWHHLAIPILTLWFWHNYFCMNTFKFAESTTHMLSFMQQKNIFKSLNAKDILKGFTFKSFTLEELGLPSSDQLLTQVKKIESEVGLQGWRCNNEENQIYKGFSITHNPTFLYPDDSIYHQTWGSYLMTQNYSMAKGIGNHTQTKDTYYDSFGFRKIPPIVKKHLGDFLNRFQYHIVRSRVAYVFGHGRGETKTAQWHVDEDPFKVLRLNIPLQTSEEHVIDIQGQDPYGNKLNMENQHLEVGKAYMWNTKVPHRITYSKKCEYREPRIHIVLGFTPYFDYDPQEDSFKINANFGKSIKDIVDNKEFIK